MKNLLGLILLAFPVVEIYGLIQLAHVLGWWLTAWLALTFITGLALIKEAGASLLMELIGSLMTPLGNIPAPIRSHRTLLAGFLLLFPGVVSDAIALGMLLFGRDELPRFAPQHVHVRGAKSSRIYEGQFRRHD
jgi:UPF0716 protein FxsA